MLWTLTWDWNWSEDEFAEPLPVIEPILFLSTAGLGSNVSTTVMWQAEKTINQSFSADVVTHELPQTTDRWAVVISPSTSWTNYRHQADAFAMYQLLRQDGYDDDHIILIVEDNLANDPTRTHGIRSPMKTSARALLSITTSATSSQRILPISCWAVRVTVCRM